MKKELVSYVNPKSPVSEIFRTLRTNIQFMNTNRKIKTLLVTSTYASEGKSWITSNLAVTFAQSGKRVLIIDADMRKGRQNVIFECKKKIGLSDCLAESCQTSRVDYSQYIQQTGIENLFLISAGTIPPNPSELLMTEGLLKLINEVESLVDIIILDGTPIELVTDSLILAKIIDGVILVSQSKTIKKEDLIKTVKKLKNVGANILGVVLNKVTINIKKYEKSYYYSSTDLKKTDRNLYKSVPRQSTIQNEEKGNKEVLQQRDESKYKNDSNYNELKNNNKRTLESTDEMIKQINEYIESQKKNLKKG